MTNPRLFINDTISEGATLLLKDAQAHYVRNVMRLSVGSKLTIFNGHNGEWIAEITELSKKSLSITALECTRNQYNAPDIWLLFAPIKAGHIDFLVEKATELGVSRLLPVKTERTVISRINLERLQAHAIEASEQSERLDVPIIEPYQSLVTVLDSWDATRPLLYGDESGNGNAASTALNGKKLPIAVLIGPEGGFSPAEFLLLKHYDFTIPLSLGSRILRADTAALAALTLMQHYCGDWYR